MDVMPFGKYSGEPLTKIPAGYFTWLLGNATNLRATTRAAIEAELERRKGTTAPAAEAAAPGPVAQVTKAFKGEIVCATCNQPGSPERPLVTVHVDCEPIPF